MTQRPPSALARPAPAVERALLRQDRTARAIIRAMGDLVPDGTVDLNQVRLALDVACGVGTWTRMLAAACPHVQVVGIDADLTVLDMARFLAEEQGLSNVHFVQDDVYSLERGLTGSDRFDLVHLSFLARALLTLDYPVLLRDLLGLLRPGGVLLWTEMEFPLTTSPACEKFFALTCRAIQAAGHSFVPSSFREMAEAYNRSQQRRGAPELGEERRHLGIVPLMLSWLRQTGYRQGQEHLAATEVSHGQPMHPHFVAEMLAGGVRLQPFLVRHGVITAEACQRLLGQVQADVRDAAFCGLCYILTASATKPEQERGQTTTVASSVRCSSAQPDERHSGKGGSQ